MNTGSRTTGKLYTARLAPLALGVSLLGLAACDQGEQKTETTAPPTAAETPAPAAETTVPANTDTTTAGDMQTMPGMSHEAMTPEQMAELRQKVPLYAELTDAQVMENMMRMPPNVTKFLSPPTVKNENCVLGLGHGFTRGGNESFENAFKTIAQTYPTAEGLGMAMMSSAEIQSAVDSLTAVGCKTIVALPIMLEEYASVHYQWQYIFGLREDSAYIHVDRVKSDAKIILAPTPTDDPLMTQILINHAMELSENPANETVIVVSHGPTTAEDNAHEMASLEAHVARMKEDSAFAEIHAITVQDDAPRSQRAANLQLIRSWIEDATKAGRTVIVETNVPTIGGFQFRLNKDLEGLDFKFNDKGMVDDPLFGQWIQKTVEAAIAKP